MPIGPGLFVPKAFPSFAPVLEGGPLRVPPSPPWVPQEEEVFMLMVMFPRAGERKAGQDWRAARPPLTERWLQRMASSPGGEQSGRPASSTDPAWQ